MEWNLRTPSEWDWENLTAFNTKAFEFPGRVQLSNHDIEVDGGVDNGSVYSSGGGGFSGSDLGHGSSSRSSISVSGDSSLKEGIKKLRNVEDFSENKELIRVGSSGNCPTLGTSDGSGEAMIGLKLGKRTYFEDVCAASTAKTTSSSVNPASSVSATKRFRTSYQSSQTPHCQVEGCNLDLKSAKDYHRRHRICENHSKSPRVIVAGLERRFCQQCSRFHELTEFDDKKRSCRRRLNDHNARRRRPHPETIQFSSGRLPSSLYGLEASAIASNSNVAPDFRRALSLLSTNSWGLNDPGPTSLDQLMHVNQTSMAQPMMLAEPHNWALASSENIHVQQTPSETRGHSLDLHNNGSSMFQEFQLFKAPYESGCFYPNQIN
ncbi:hypothetical protein PVL29_014694 [Vitis rotundifolia]|uniref:SBP-type domain-containing protein n=1 Tax=Vitis rotundifolia TaxID=103349 RepID=A0AA38ZI00_VITRO|nr:hypothetical protein PVL29_014694 [Vitis rotundifolia]